MTDYQQGSVWRKWDLHVHSPASDKFKGDFNQFVIQIGGADCDVIGVNDYFSVAGYKELAGRLNDPGQLSSGNQAYREALEKLRSKTLLPVVECRMTNVVLDRTKKAGPRINFHIIFSPDVSVDDIETFIKGLMVNKASIGGRYDDKAFLLEKASIDFSDALKKLRSDETFKNRFLIWIPYDEYGGIDKINPDTDTFFKEGLVYNADILGSSSKAQAEFFLWKDEKFTKEQYKTWFGRPKPCIKGSDSHSVNDEIGKLKDRDSKPTDKYCWIKADPTFDGLRQIINEPEDRVYIGRIPPKLEVVRQNPTRYLTRVEIRRTAEAPIDDVWFDCDLRLNSDMVSIIGNKGSGKSALADVLALAGNTHCDPSYFSFLSKERFCERNGRLAKNFEVKAEWADGTTTVHRLNEKPDQNKVELVRYIPQSYLEKVCTETEPGEQSEFQRELRKVIFSHIGDADRLGKDSLDDLLEYQTEELKAKLSAAREEMSKVNTELVRVQAKQSNDYVTQLRSQQHAKQKELDAHIAAKPKAIEKPSDAGAEEQKAITAIAGKLDAERKALEALEKQIAKWQTRLKVLAEDIALVKKLELKIDGFETDYSRLKQECSADFIRLEIDLGDVVNVSINKTELAQKRERLVAEKGEIDKSLSPTNDGGSYLRRETHVREIKALQECLDAPNRNYQAYQEITKSWQQRSKQIEGSKDEQNTLRYFQSQIKYVAEIVPGEIAALIARRLQIARKLHENIADIRDVYRQLFAPVQDLIQGSVVMKEGFRLSFDGRIIERRFQHDLFEKYVNQGVAGSFCGKDKGAAVLENILSEYEFNKTDDALAFADDIIRHLEKDLRAGQPVSMDIQAQLRKHVDLKSLYDYVWSFQYLEPEYSLRLDGKDLSRLSPGERGTLLLVFYLLVDKTSDPIIVDQPEENLDNQTVYKLLIPIIREVKKRRQIVMVTHSPNIAVVCDSEQVIHASINRAEQNRVTYMTGAIESPDINRLLVDVLEGTLPAFDNRDSKYYRY